MKTRKGFVSNSSTSSFLCEVCGSIEAGRDASPSDFGMSECVHGHVFCDCHSPRKDLLKSYESAEVSCPICSLTHISDDVLLKYILKHNKLDKEVIIKEIKETYTYKELIDYIKNIPKEVPKEPTPKKLRLRQ
jgi:hypothetical protein